MAGYAYIWEYEVPVEHGGAFERAYGPEGDWVRLFRGAPGYVRTELHRDRARPGRYVTIDWWESEADWRAFREGRARVRAARRALRRPHHARSRDRPLRRRGVRPAT